MVFFRNKKLRCWHRTKSAKACSRGSDLLISTSQQEGEGVGHVKSVDENAPIRGEGNACFLINEETSQMTTQRLLSRYLSKYNWYSPTLKHSYAGNGAKPPSLDAAWTYYEHVTLPRYYAEEPPNGTSGMVRAEVGEMKRKTSLYPFWKTPVRELMDLGISARMYFSTLLALSAILLSVGLMNTPLMWFFQSSGYSENGKGGISTVITYSAICDTKVWVPCESCNDEYKDFFPDYRIDGENVMKNDCDISNGLYPALANYASSVILVCLFVVAFFGVQKKAEVMFDEEIQTPSDYTVKISNPPPDAYDPEEWREFLTPFAERNLVCCTIALDNKDLVHALVNRRRVIRKLQGLLPPQTDMADEDAVRHSVAITPPTPAWKRAFQYIGLFPDAHVLLSRMESLNDKIQTLKEREHQVTAVFATYETEAGQRNALSALSTGKLYIRNNARDSRFKRGAAEIKVKERTRVQSFRWNDLSAVLVEPSDTHRERLFKLPRSHDGSLDSILLFRGKHVLNVTEAGEPDAVRWQDLHVSGRVKILQRLCTSILVSIAIAAAGVFVFFLERIAPGTYYTPTFIAGFNVLIPKVCNAINLLESHSTEGKRQAWLYVKIALFRWFNSAIVTTIVKGFLNTISFEDGREKENLLYSIYPIFFAEMVTIPLLQIIDVAGLIRKHILAPRARDQEHMNLCFTGSRFELAERYTDVTKIIFMTFFYSAIFPQAYFLGSISLFIHYWIGKFCLLRLWRPAPAIGKHLSSFSRNYFFSVALLAQVILSGYWWSGFPFDNVCDGDEDGEYIYCNQDYLRTGIFPPLPMFQRYRTKWMSQTQEIMTSMYGWTAIAVLVVVLVIYLKENIVGLFRSMFRSTYQPEGKDRGVDFSSLKDLHEISCYIHQVHESDFMYPLLACNVDGIDKGLVGWTDPERGFKPHNLIYDLPNSEQTISGKPCFAIVKQWTATSSQEGSNEMPINIPPVS